MLKLPESIQSMIGDSSFTIDTMGMSNSQVFCFDKMVLKIERKGEESNNEHRMMNWLHGKLCTPNVLCFQEREATNYLLMSKLDGQMLCAEDFLKKPSKLISLLAKGLKMLWDVDISDCPYNNAVDNKLRLAEIRVANQLCAMEDAEPETYGENAFQSPSHLLAWLKANKPLENAVLSHGDYCLPNIFAKDDSITGFIDLGRSGIADPYQDIALCYRSLKHNGIKPDTLFEELGIVPDWERIAYYILLDELF